MTGELKEQMQSKEQEYEAAVNSLKDQVTHTMETFVNCENTKSCSFSLFLTFFLHFFSYSSFNLLVAPFLLYLFSCFSVFVLMWTLFFLSLG